jgi:hypothetical protein
MPTLTGLVLNLLAGFETSSPMYHISGQPVEKLTVVLTVAYED